MNPVDSILVVEHRMCNIEQAHVGRGLESFVQIFRGSIRLEALPAGVDLANRLLKALLERAPNSHNFTDGLHR